MKGGVKKEEETDGWEEKARNEREGERDDKTRAGETGGWRVGEVKTEERSERINERDGQMVGTEGGMERRTERRRRRKTEKRRRK